MTTRTVRRRPERKRAAPPPIDHRAEEAEAEDRRMQEEDGERRQQFIAASPRRNGRAAEAAPFDLEMMDTRGFARLNIVTPDGRVARDSEGQPVWIDLWSLDSEVYRKAQREALDRRVRRARTREGAEALAAEAIEQESFFIMARCTKDWSSAIALAGEKLPCTFDNAKRLYETYPALREQVEGFIRSRVNFMPSPQRK